jgi:hypothetical protein
LRIDGAEFREDEMARNSTRSGERVRDVWRRGPLFTMGGAALLTVMAVACGQEFTESCAETRSCPTGGDGPDSEGGEAGQAGESNRGGSSNSGGKAGSGGKADGGGKSDAGGGSEECGGGCSDGETCCDGECVDTSSDAAHCGACGHVCEGPHAEYACVESQCEVVACEDGFVDCNDAKPGCETKDAGLPGAPWPYLPMAGTYTGAVRAEKSLKPKFAWRESGTRGTCGEVTYEIELTRECEPGKLEECAFANVDVQKKGIEEPEWTPSEPLPVSLAVPVGAFYAWRVRACEAPGRCSAWSRVSYVNVGRLIDDLNADGYSDLVELGGSARAWFSAGGGNAPLTQTVAVENSVFGNTLEPNRGAFLGDVNGDGFPDMLLWSTAKGTATTAPLLVFGASTLDGWSSVPVTPWSERYWTGGRAGDLDSDGFADVVLTEFDDRLLNPSSSIVRIFRGRPAFTWSSPVVLSAPVANSVAFGVAVAGNLDSNRDGVSDLFLLDDSLGSLHLAYGGETIPTVTHASVESSHLVGTADRYQASDLMVLGDRNGDGYDDIAAYVINTMEVAGENSTIQLFHGGMTLQKTPAATLRLDARYGLEWFGGHDLGRDGRADLVLIPITDPTRFSFKGYPRLLPGSSVAQSAADLIRWGDLPDTMTNTGLSGGDYDGDGVIDLTLRVQHQTRGVFRGGKPAPSSPGCAQPPAFFESAGNWCAVESSIFEIENEYRWPRMTVR